MRARKFVKLRFVSIATNRRFCEFSRSKHVERSKLFVELSVTKKLFLLPPFHFRPPFARSRYESQSVDISLRNIFRPLFHLQRFFFNILLLLLKYTSPSDVTRYSMYQSIGSFGEKQEFGSRRVEVGTGSNCLISEASSAINISSAGRRILRKSLSLVA